MNLVLFLSVIMNLGSLAMFTYLAYHFNKWWIVLFAIFFYRDLHYKTTYKNGGEDDEDI